MVTRLLLLCALGGCTLFDEPPRNECTTDQQCFRAQGERCNATKHVCEPAPDAGAGPADAAQDAP